MALPLLNSRPQDEAGTAPDWQRTFDLSRVELARALDDLNSGLEKLFPPQPALAQDWPAERIRPMLWQDGQVSPQEFESLLTSLESLYPGPFLDGAALSGFFASPFHSALYRLADRSLQQNACLPAFPLDDPFPAFSLGSERTAALQAWYRQQSKALDPAPSTQLPVAAPEASSRFEAFDGLLTLFPYSDNRLVAFAHEMSGSLDSRPAHRSAQCRWRSALGLKALAEDHRRQAARWFDGLQDAGCAHLALSPEMARMIRQGRPPSSPTAHSED